MTHDWQTSPTTSLSTHPIGVFDSGVGGLSVLRHMHTLLPSEDLFYFADCGFAPYGEKPESLIVERVLSITKYLSEHNVKALVVACNTATAAAIEIIRNAYPDLIIIGVEPGLKPAAALCKTKIIGVLATHYTVHSKHFNDKKNTVIQHSQVRIICQACHGLADQIEKGELSSPATTKMVRDYVVPLIEQGADTIVLGCTHYPLVQQLIEDVAASVTSTTINIIDTGTAVAKQVAYLLLQHHLQRTASDAGVIHITSTGDTEPLHMMVNHLFPFSETSISHVTL